MFCSKATDECSIEFTVSDIYCGMGWGVVLLGQGKSSVHWNVCSAKSVEFQMGGLTDTTVIPFWHTNWWKPATKTHLRHRDCLERFPQQALWRTSFPCRICRCIPGHSREHDAHHRRKHATWTSQSSRKVARCTGTWQRCHLKENGGKLGVWGAQVSDQCHNSTVNRRYTDSVGSKQDVRVREVDHKIGGIFLELPWENTLWSSITGNIHCRWEACSLALRERGWRVMAGEGQALLTLRLAALSTLRMSTP